MDEQGFKKLRAKLDVRLEQEANAKYEHARVDFVVRRLCLKRYKLKSLAEQRATHLFTFEDLGEAYPEFPFRLMTDRMGGRQLHRDPKTTFPEWFRKFENLPFAQAFKTFHENCGKRSDHRSLGLVFPRRGFSQGMLIFEDREELRMDGVAVVYSFSKKHQEHKWLVRPFMAVVDAIKGLSGA